MGSEIFPPVESVLASRAAVFFPETPTASSFRQLPTFFFVLYTLYGTPEHQEHSFYFLRIRSLFVVPCLFFLPVFYRVCCLFLFHAGSILGSRGGIRFVSGAGVAASLETATPLFCALEEGSKLLETGEAGEQRGCSWTGAV